MFFSHIYLTYSVVHCYVTRAGSRGGYQVKQKFAFEGTFLTCFLGTSTLSTRFHPSGLFSGEMIIKIRKARSRNFPVRTSICLENWRIDPQRRVPGRYLRLARARQANGFLPSMTDVHSSTPIALTESYCDSIVSHGPASNPESSGFAQLYWRL